MIYLYLRLLRSNSWLFLKNSLIEESYHICKFVVKINPIPAPIVICSREMPMISKLFSVLIMIGPPQHNFLINGMLKTIRHEELSFWIIFLIKLFSNCNLSGSESSEEKGTRILQIYSDWILIYSICIFFKKCNLICKSKQSITNFDL